MKKIYFILLALVAQLAVAPAFANVQMNNDELSRFEQTNICRACDLSNAIFQNGNHSEAVLDNSNLSMSNYFGQSSGFNLSAASLRNVNFSGAKLAGANFSAADLDGASFAGAHVERANFYGARGNFNLDTAYACGVTHVDGTQGEAC